MTRFNRNHFDGGHHDKFFMLNRPLTTLIIIGADTGLKNSTKFINRIIWICLLHLTKQLRLLLSRTKKDVAFFRISLSRFARQSSFPSACIFCCSAVSAFLPSGVSPFISAKYCRFQRDTAVEPAPDIYLIGWLADWLIGITFVHHQFCILQFLFYWKTDSLFSVLL